jgi:hypothetical protein
VKDIHDLFEDKARAGDALYAIAFAILKVADHQRESASALDRMGMNRMVPGGPPGTSEMIAMQMETIADALTQIASNN